MASLKQRLADAARGRDGATGALLEEGAERFARIPVEFVEPDPDQPRKTLGSLDELKASLKEHGIIQPIVVSPHGPDRFRIIAGERRYSAAKAIGMASVPAIIRTIEEHRRLEVQLIENIHRQQLNPVEEAAAYKRLLEEFRLSQRQLAARLGRSPAVINETLRILDLPERILDSVRTSEHLSRSVLLEIAKQENDAARDALWKAAMEGSVTVKTARQHKEGEAPPKKARVAFPFKTSRATITVVFQAEEASMEDVVDALAEALLEARAALRAKESGHE